MGFSEAVQDLVDIVRTETSKRGRARAKLRGDEFCLSPVRFRHDYRESALSPATPERNFNGFLPPRYICIHFVHLSTFEISILSD